MSLVGGHLTRLFDPTGRENRQPFWLWVLISYGAQTVLSTVLMIGLMFGMQSTLAPLQQYDQAYLNGHPEVASQLMMTAMLPFFRTILVFTVVMGLLFLALLGAAVVRRLHDTDRSGWWALPVAIIQALSLTSYALIVPRLFTTVLQASASANASPDAGEAAFASIMPLFALAGLLGTVGFAFMILLIVFLAQRGTIGPNRYGEDLLPPPPVHPYSPQQWQPAPPPQREPPARVVRPWGDPPA